MTKPTPEEVAAFRAAVSRKTKEARTGSEDGKTTAKGKPRPDVAALWREAHKVARGSGNA